MKRAIAVFSARAPGRHDSASIVVRGQDAVAVAASGECEQVHTVWEYVGFPSACQMEKSHEMLGRTPLMKAMKMVMGPAAALLGMVPGPPPLEDPANLLSKIPAVKAAAEVKQQEDAVPQKIQAINYLATIGCDCYPGVREALIAALEDCNEKVRLAAIRAIVKSKCCHPEVVEKLSELAYETDETGRFKEPSQKVRKAARKALRACGCDLSPAPAPEPIPQREAPRPQREAPGTAAQQTLLRPLQGPNRQIAHVRRAGISSTVRNQVRKNRTQVPQWVNGIITAVDLQNGTVGLSFPRGWRGQPGMRVKVYHKYLFRTEFLGELEIARAEAGKAIARPTTSLALRKVHKGDDAVLWLK